jgi:hypothetical protein
MDTKLLTLSEAARACHRSHGTLRRLIEAGRLIPEPREDQNKRIFVSVAALNSAGLEILDEPFSAGRSSAVHAETERLKSEVERLKSEVEAAHGEIADLQAQCEVLVSGVGRAEVALEGTRVAYDALRRVRVGSVPPPPWIAADSRQQSTEVDSGSSDAKHGSHRSH